MSDQKPPRTVGGERETLQALLQYQRESVVRKVAGVSDADARRQFVGSGTSLIWLVKHLTRAESTWVEARFAGLVVKQPVEEVKAGDMLSQVIDDYRQGWERIDAIVSRTPSLDEFCKETGAESPVTLRWVLAHLLEETARHAGHADILRELIDGSIGR